MRFHERFVLLISQTRYNSPFLHRCVKTEFLFSLSLSLYSVLHVSNYNVRILQINLRSTHSTRLFSTFSLPPLLFRDSSVSTVKLRANTTDLSIYPKNRKLKRRRMRLRFEKRSRFIYRFPSPLTYRISISRRLGPPPGKSI